MVPLAVSITAWWFLMKFSPIIGNDVFDSMTNVSVKVYVPMLNWMQLWLLVVLIVRLHIRF